MADRISPAVRSKNMQAIKSKNTKPEIAVRRILTDLGYRYRLHCRNLPGNPDIVFIGRKKVIFVHGCFWHLHDNCKKSRIPEIEYWQVKLRNNKKRDIDNIALLENLGWKPLIIWECEIRHDLSALGKKVISFLES